MAAKRKPGAKRKAAAKRRVFYRLGHDPLTVFVGVKISQPLSDGIDRDWPASGGRKADFIRLLLEEGLKAWRARNIPNLPGA
jgi:hypothetical protein